jgi:hypothetical protein
VVDQDDLLRLQQPLRDHEGADHVVGDNTARVPDDVCITVIEAEHLENVHPAVHAGNDREVPPR